MRTALFLILLTGIALAGAPAAHAQDADTGLRAEAEYTLGITASEAGHREEAIGHFKAALALDPTHRLAPVEYEKLIRTPGRSLAKVVADYDELLKLAPGRAWLLNNYGYLLRSTAEAHGAAQVKEVSRALRYILERAVQVYEAACKLTPKDTQMVSDTGLVLEFYPAVRDDEKALTYFQRALDQTDGLYRDAYNGLVRVCERTKDWKTLKKRSAQLVEQMKAGKSAVSPRADGNLRDIESEGNAILLAHAEKALETSTFFLTGGAHRRPVPAPDMRVATEALTGPRAFRLEKPREDRQRKGVKLKYETRKPIEYRATKTVEELVGTRTGRPSSTSMTLRLERDKAEKGALRITADGDPRMAAGYLLARMDKFGAVDEASLAAVAVPTPRIEHGAAASLFRCIVPVPNRKVRIGEVWEVDLLGLYIRDTGLPVPEGIVSATAWQTLVGIEKIDGKRYAKLRLVYNATIKSKSLRLMPHHAPAEGLVHIKGTCTVLHGLDGVPRRITWFEQQRLGLEKAKVVTGRNGETGLSLEYVVRWEIEAGPAPKS